MSFEPTYEELKLSINTLHGSKCNGFEPTYEELKLVCLFFTFCPLNKF